MRSDLRLPKLEGVSDLDFKRYGYLKLLKGDRDQESNRLNRNGSTREFSLSVDNEMILPSERVISKSKGII